MKHASWAATLKLVQEQRLSNASHKQGTRLTKAVSLLFFVVLLLRYDQEILKNEKLEVSDWTVEPDTTDGDETDDDDE